MLQQLFDVGDTASADQDPAMGSSRRVQVVFRGVIVADSIQSRQMGLVYGIPLADVRMDYLVPSSREGYFDLVLMEWRVA
ncbi:MAG TPA: hypothetical protein VGO93_27960, partial [Candidatus Xenobia bacterium]